MTDDHCNCVDTTQNRNRHVETTGRLLTAGQPLEATLPVGLRTALGRFVGRDSIETVADWIAAVRRQMGDGPLTVEELCHVEGETNHWGDLGGEKQYFACFYDAVILAALTEQPVEIHTESPDGTVVEAYATGDGELTVTPETAVFSFGIDDSVAPPSGAGPSLEEGYAALCPYVRAFPDVDAYEQWSDTISAETVGLPLSGAVELAEALVEP